MKDLLHSRFIQTVLSAATSLLHWNCRSAMTEKVEFVRFILLFAV